MKKFVFTCGDINGIGPEIVIKLLNRICGRTPHKYIFICPRNVFSEITRLVKPQFKYQLLEKDYDSYLPDVTVLDIGNFRISPGKPSEESGRASFEAIKLSYHLLYERKADAVITAPISKTALKLAGINFPGHTEMFAEWCGVKNYVMMFLSKKMNAALATIHEPLQKVPGLLNTAHLKSVFQTVINTLKKDLNIQDPKIAVLGLNPHAGEDGLIGEEEKKIIKPVIGDFKGSVEIEGPFVPDAFFANKKYSSFDMVIGMYHDQVLIPFKLLNFSSGVNYTAGLEIIRTSPDHGTAYDIAGKNIAEESSLHSAFTYAVKISANRSKYEHKAQ